MIDNRIPNNIKDKKCCQFVKKGFFSLFNVDILMCNISIMLIEICIWSANLCIWLLCNQKLQIYNLLYSRALQGKSLIYQDSEIMEKVIENTTIVSVKPFENHGWVKWCAFAMYLETIVCCYILGILVWKEMSKKLTAISYRPLTHQLVVFSIIMVSR